MNGWVSMEAARSASGLTERQIIEKADSGRVRWRRVDGRAEFRLEDFGTPGANKGRRSRRRVRMVCCKCGRAASFSQASVPRDRRTVCHDCGAVMVRAK